MKLKILLILFLLLGNANAAIKYLRAGATGSANGNDWTNAYTTLAALQAGMARGDTGYIAEGTYPGWFTFTFNKPASGTLLMTIKKAIPSDHGTDTGWSDSFGDGQAIFDGGIRVTTPYWVIDGQTGGGPGSWNSGYGFKADNSSQGTSGQSTVQVRGVSNVTIRHVEIKGAYPLAVADGNNPDGINTWDAGSQNCTFSYLWIYDVARCPIFNAGSNMVFEYIYTGRFGSGTGHSETMSSWVGLDGSGNPGCFNVTVRWSIFTHFQSTGGLLAKGNGYYYYGNVFHRTSNNTMPHGFHGKWDQKPLVNLYAWNNTYIDPYPTSPFLRYNHNSGESVTSNLNVHNGIFFNDAAWDISDNLQNTTHNYNHMAACSGVIPNATAGEANGSSSSATPFVNYPAGNYGLTAAQAAAIPAAQTLGAPWNTHTGWNVDMFGNVRGADGKWDRGAIEFVSGGGSDTTAPTIFSAQVDAGGDDLIVTFSEPINLNAGTGMSISASGGAVTLSNAQETGTAEITYDITGRAIGPTETVTATYATTANGIEDLAGNDLAAFSGFSVTNNSAQGVVATPVIGLDGGSYFGTQNVQITCPTPGATIRYTTDGSTPTSSTGTVYTGPVPISAPTNLGARAFLSGSTDSAAVFEAYEVGTWVTDPPDWKEILVPQQTGIFTWRFRASVPIGNADSVIGMGPTVGADHWDDTAIALRFKNTGIIDAIHGALFYQAVNPFTYDAGTACDFVVTVNVPERTYSATVVPASGGTPTVIAQDYDFRPGHEATSDLDFAQMLGYTTTLTVTNMSFGTDTVAPIPNPLTWASNPTAVDSFSVIMTASTAVDDLNNPVQYFFEETSGNAGATDSGWQTSATYIDAGLTPNTQYSYYVWARDNVLNQGSPSATLSATTPLVVTSGSAANCETLNVTTLRVGP